MRQLDEGFDRFVVEASPALLRTAYRLTGDVHLAEDLLQSALWRVARRWHAASDNPVAYARKVLVNLASDGWRARARRVREVPGHVPETRNDVSDAVDDEILGAINALAPRQRAVVVLRYWEDRSVEETAALLGCTAGTVKSTASKALAHLRTNLLTQGVRQ
jgi:RNA polymerase sigma-70 factor (sigma-E family)